MNRLDDLLSVKHNGRFVSSFFVGSSAATKGVLFMIKILAPTIADLALASKAPNVLASKVLAELGASGNTLTGLFPDLYAGLDVVSRELVGFIPSVNLNADGMERAAVGENVTYHIAPATTAFDVTPAMAVPEPTDQTIGTGQIQITKSRGVNFGFVGEEQRGLNNGPGYLTVQADMFSQGLRTLCNEIEVDLGVEAYKNASRAYGAAGTTPFATNVGESAQIRKILDDNGAPRTGRSLIIDTTAGASLRTLAQLTKANEAGTTMTLRDGQLLDLNGLSIKESAGVQRFTAGTNNGSASTNNAGYAAGATTFTLASAGTGTILAGDVITFAGDTNKYMVVTGDADVSNGGTFVIAAPGIRVAIAASNTVITTIATTTRNIAFSRDALHLVARAPALPQQGDLALDRYMIVDPRSGLPFEVSLYPGYRKIRAEVAMAWGVKAVKRNHIAALLG